MSVFVAPDSTALQYGGYYSLLKTSQRAEFRRCFDPQHGCDPLAQQIGRQFPYNPGARVSLVTDAQRAYVLLEYGVSCSAACPGTPPSHCYRPSPGEGLIPNLLTRESLRFSAPASTRQVKLAVHGCAEKINKLTD